MRRAHLSALALLATMLLRRRREQQHAARRERAAELRAEADQHAGALPDAELRAKEREVQAEKLRRDAEQAQQRAREAETDYLQQSAAQEDRLREARRIDPDTGKDDPPADPRRQPGEGNPRNGTDI